MESTEGYYRYQDAGPSGAAAGAILVLMVLLVLMNSVAIFLRNRYEQKW